MVLPGWRRVAHTRPSECAFARRVRINMVLPGWCRVAHTRPSECAFARRGAPTWCSPGGAYSPGRDRCSPWRVCVSVVLQPKFSFLTSSKQSP